MKTVLSLLCTLALAGCALTREPLRTPDLPLPDALPAVTGATPDLPDPWWSLFQDPTLDALVREALNRNTDVLIAAARVQEARALAGIADADRLPTLNVEAGAVRGRESSLSGQDGAEGAGEIRNDYAVQGVVGYEVDLWGRYAHASTAARARLLASEFDRDALRLSVTGVTARAYFALAAAIQQYGQARETLINREEFLRIERLRFEAGESDEITLRRVEGEVEATRAALHSYELDAEQRQNVLAILVGRNPAEMVEQRILPTMPATAAPVPLLPAHLPSALMARRPDIRAAEARIAAAAGDVGAARAALLPGVSLTGALGSASLDLADLFTPSAEAWSISATVLQPIFQGGRLRADVTRTRAVQEQVIADYSRTVQESFREVLDGLRGQTSLHDLTSARAAQVEALRRATELADLRYTEGEIAYLELLDVRRALFAAQVELIAARNQLQANAVDLALALGGGPGKP